MYRFIHHNTTDSIRSMVDVYSFRSEELILNLSELEVLVPDFVDQYFKTPVKGMGVFVEGEIYPRLNLSTRDNLFLKTPSLFLPVNKSVIEDLKNVYLRSPYINTEEDPSRLIGLEYYFGKNIKLYRSVKALRKIVAIWVVCLFTNSLKLCSFSQDLKLPKLSTLFPGADVGLWREHFYKTYNGLRNKHTGEPLESPDESEFEWGLIQSLGVHLKEIFKEIEKFVDNHRDCLYSVEINGNKLSIVRGIDHKYIPYYELKYKQESPEENFNVEKPFKFNEEEGIFYVIRN